MADVEKQAQAEKELGNAAYKKKDFATAHQHYDKAIQLSPNNITFYTNKAAVYFEEGNYEECIKTCEQAATVGRESRADFKLIAKAFARMGNAYRKQDDLENALVYFNKSITEHRNPDVVKQVHEIEKLKKAKERLAYINPELSMVEKNKGNVFFREGKWPEAIKCYSEAIKRNPDDAKIYSNRAACYSKLMEFSLALKDCDECIRLDPTFIKGYLRKANCLVAMKDTAKAQDAYHKALEIDPNCQEALQGYRQCLDSESPEDVKRRAMADPEVQAILNDPAMRLILDQMQNDPTAAREHLKNPDVAAKIEKLFASKLIAFR